MRKIIRLAKGSSFFELHPPHFGIVGVNPTHAVIGGAGSIGHVALLENLRRKPLEQRNLGADVIEVFDAELNLVARFGAARLKRRASREKENKIRSERAEGNPQTALESSAVGEQQHDGRDAPGHTKHGQNATAFVMAQRAVCLDSQIADHGYSCLKASTGSRRAACRAG